MAVSPLSPSMREHLQHYLHSTDASLFGERDYEAFASVFAQKIDNMRGNATIIYCPIESGAPILGGPIVDEFEKRGVPYYYVPVSIKNREVVKPSPYNLKRTIGHVKDGNFIILPFDDTTATGRTVYTFYETLIHYGIPDDQIWLSGIIDKTGTLRSFIDVSGKRSERQAYHSKLKDAGLVPPMMFPEIAFVPQDDPERPMLEQLVAENRILSYTLEQSARDWSQLNASFLENTLFKSEDSGPLYDFRTARFIHRSRQKSVYAINNNFDPTLGGGARTKYRYSINGLPMLGIHYDFITKDNLPPIEETAADMFIMDLALGDLLISGHYYTELKSGMDVNSETLGQQLIEPAIRYEKTLWENLKNKRIKKGVFNPDPLGRAALGTAFLEVADPITPEVTSGHIEALLSGHFNAWETHYLQKRPKLINRIWLRFSHGKRPCQALTLRSLVPPRKLKDLYPHKMDILGKIKEIIPSGI